MSESLFDYMSHKSLASSQSRAEKQDQNAFGLLHVKAYWVDEIAELLDVTAGAWDLLYEKGAAIWKSNGETENRTEWRRLTIFKPFF